MFSNDGYALLIGVDDYGTFDDARRNAPGTSDLGGSRNDVRAFWGLCRRLGIKPVNIRVLTSPPIDYRELEGASPESVGPATEAQILAQTRWLAARLAHASKPTGLLTYSGHGDALAGEGLVLCPSDVGATPGADGEPQLTHTVSLRKLDELLAGCADNLTVVLDTCHAGLTGRAPAAEAHVDTHVGLSGRVLAATRHHQVAYQATLGGQPRGVFSWALTTAMEQWKASQEGSTVRLDLSYGKLVETAGRLMSALSFDEAPELHGPAGLADLAVFHPGLVGHPGETHDRPDGDFKTKEIDPGTKDYIIYSVLDVTGAQIGQILVTTTASGIYSANREYWYVTTNLSNSTGATFVPGTAEYWSTPPSGLGTLSFTMSSTFTWTGGSYHGTLPTGASATGIYLAMNWQVVVSAGVWLGNVIWWQGNSTGTIFGGTASTTLTPGRVTGNHYYINNATL